MNKIFAGEYEFYAFRLVSILRQADSLSEGCKVF